MLECCGDSGFIGGDITERDATLCFCCARMAVVDGRTARGYAKENNLPFEGFLEALCRLSMLKALPTDAELEAAGQPNAALYLAELRLSDEERYRVMLEKRAKEWGAQPSANMPVHRCIEHLCALLVHAVAEDPSSTEVSSVDMIRWQEKVAPAAERGS